jgi:L,D-transpeptidase YcbB
MIALRIARAAGAALIIGISGFPAAFAQVQDPVEASAGSLTPEAETFRAELAAATASFGDTRSAAIEDFYAARDYAPFWTVSGGAALVALREALEDAPAHGLPASRYDPAALDAAAAPAEVEAAAMRQYLRYASDVSSGILVPVEVDDEINVTPHRVGAEHVLTLLASEDAETALAQAAPADPDYAALMAEKRRLEGILGAEAWGAPVPSGPTLREGDRDPRVAALRDRLDRMGYPAAIEQGSDQPKAGDAEPADPLEFDAALAARLGEFQRDYGLLDDGAAGPRTLAALNASPEERLKQVVVNLERLRWMNRDLGARHFEVNIPDFTVTLYDGDTVLWDSRAVVGERHETRTPEFSDEMTYMVVNPTWHIPDSIAIRTYLPKLQQNPDVLANSNMRLFTRSGEEINPRLVNFDQYTPESFPFRFKQNPNSANALGRVKFMFPNQFAIYLHDTPHRELFERDARAFSNGCVRLEEPIELAQVLLQGQEADPAAAFDAWLTARKERQVNLDQPVPVHILYRTVWSEDGAIRFRADIYGRDARVFDALQATGVTLPEPPVQG